MRGIQVDPPEFLIRTVKVDLECQVFETGDGLSGYLVYNRDLFAASTIKSLAQSFSVLLRSIAEGMDRDVCAYPLLSATDSANSHLGEIDSGPLCEKSIHRYFETQAAANQTQRPRHTGPMC